MVSFPRNERPTVFQRNASFSVKRGSSAMQEARMRSGLFTKNRGSQNGVDVTDTMPRNSKLPDDIVEKYKEAIMHYSKFKNAGVIEMEASIKACKVLIMQQKFLEASEFLQNVVYINLQLTDEEKIQRYSTLALLYSQIGFNRKAAFFKRVAAMQCVAPTNQRPQWLQCYNLLLQALDGYRLSLDPRDYPDDKMCGWPVIQLRVFHELIYAARKMGNPAIAVRHMTLLLHSMFIYLSSQEKKEISNVLESYTAKCEGLPQPLALENGTILPPVALARLPTVRTFKLHNLAPHLRPVKLKSEANSNRMHNSPFIYSPIQYSADKHKVIKCSSKMDFKWVEGDVCEVAMQVYNPMPFELKIAHVGLLSDGVEFESYPASLSLPAESGPYPVKILGTPKDAGELNVLGYTTHVLGVRSHCRLRDLHVIKESKYSVTVVPPLPQIHVTTSLPKAASFSNLGDSANVVTSAVKTLFAGESHECQITIKNVGKLPVERVDVSLDSRMEKSFVDQVFVWNSANLHSQLPIAVGGEAIFTLYIYGLSDFLPIDRPDLRPQHQYSRGMSSPIKESGNAGSPDSGVQSLEALLKIQYSGGAGLVEGYCRQCAISMNVDIQPSFVFTKWDVLPSDSSQHCFLILDLQNMTTHSTEVISADEQMAVMKEKETKRIAVKIGKCPFPEETFHQHSTRGLGTNSPYSQQNSLVHSQAVASFVDIRWKTVSGENQGKICIDNLSWKPHQLELLRLSPIQWEVAVNGTVFTPDTELIYTTGELVEIEAELINNADFSLEDVTLSMEVFQDLDEGSHLASQESSTTIVGSQNITLPKISSYENLSHKCQILFLTQGVYKLDVKCSCRKTCNIGEQDSSNVQIWRCLPAAQIRIEDE